MDEEILKKTILDLTHERGADKTLCPSEVARHLAGTDEKKWRLLMKPIRAVAITMANSNEIAIKRKGKPVNPNDFKGIYRLGLPNSKDET